MSFIPLHVHSHWSLLDGVPSVAEVVAHAQTLELPALALTDSNALYGAVEFVSRCQDAGMWPVLGAELTYAGGHTLTLLAQDRTGYGNLCRLISLMQGEPERDALLARGVSLDTLAGHADGIIALSGGRTGPLDARLRSGDYAGAESLAGTLADLFGRDRFCIELQIFEDSDEVLAGKLQSLADERGVRTVATHDSHYLTPDDAGRYRVLVAMRTGAQISSLAPLPDLSLLEPDAMRARFALFPDALEHTAVIAALCDAALPLGQFHFPLLDLPSGRTPPAELWAVACDGARARYGILSSIVEARLRKESDIITQLGYAPYFLVVADIVRFARERGVPISPRGSASSSVVAFCLGIHDVDPLAHNLYFERFLSLERHDPPDIDLDLCSRRRDEVIDYVYRRYGAERVAMVCTHSTLRPPSALREAGKAFGLSEARIKELSAFAPRWWPGLTREKLEAARSKLVQQARDANEQAALQMALDLERTPHHQSIHPGGIVIAPGAITDFVPLQHSTKGLRVTQFDSGAIEELGLVKIDLLGISALTVMADCAELVRARAPGFELATIPSDDLATAETLVAAQTIGCFQIESPGMRLTLREVSARSAGDLIVALALYRPGPLKGGLKDAFVRRHLQQEAATYLHPALEPVLGETYGVVLYQEQVLRIAHEVAGFTLGEADLLRRAMGKERSAPAMERHKQKFVSGAHRTSRLDAATAEQVWELMAAFAGYGFPKAHAAGYAVVAYRMAWLKTHYPAEFMAARLAVGGGFYSPRTYMSEARRLGIAVCPPHVNHSAAHFTLARDTSGQPVLYMGLRAVRELTHTTLRRIIAQQPFASFDDFLIRAQPQHIEAINLVKASALEGLCHSAAALARLDAEHWHGRHSAQHSLPFAEALAGPLESTLATRAAWEREVLGMPVSVHPLQLVAQTVARYRLVSSAAMAAHAGQVITMAGVRVGWPHDLAQMSGQPILYADLEDEAGIYAVRLEGITYRKFRDVFKRREPLLVRGVVEAHAPAPPVLVADQVQICEA